MTDISQRFEDAEDSKIESKPEAPTQTEHSKPPDVNPSKDESSPQANGNLSRISSQNAETQADVDPVKRDSGTPSQQSTTDDQGRRSVKSMAASFEGSDTTPTATAPKPPPRPSRFQGFSASLPSVPWGAPPPRKLSTSARDPSPQPPSATTARKVTTPFGWFSRTTSAAKEPRSPSLPATGANDARRNTATSISTLGSNAELTLKALEERGEPGKQTLREKFKALRMREEAGIKSLDDPEKPEGGAIAGLIGRSASLGLGIASPTTVDGEDKVVSTPVMTPSSPKADPTHTINPNLAPGTVSGVSTSATDAATPIDWDFWQTVVNEGPQAVSRTSPEELAAAVSSGIPQTIRGVIWQVLAGSKNDDLEGIYHELRSRGTSVELKETPSQQTLAVGQPIDSIKEKESVSSSKSSIRSGHSTPATSANIGLGSPSPSHEMTDPLSSAKVQVQLAADRAKRAKEDAAALAKLEKMIKRDMGSRTSFSKYTTAAGLQEPLFNICKAYALFDDVVGYPQGMNFIIMPLLFIMSEEEAFCLLVRLMNKYQLRELFIHDMPGLHLHLYQFERLLEDLEPALYCHLNRRGVTPRLYATQWFLTLFAYRFPLQLVMRVYDLVLCEGLEGAILKFGMAVIQGNVQTLLAMNDMQTLTNFLKEKLFDVYIDAAPSSKSILESGFFGSSGGADSEVYRADLIVQDASAIKLTPEMLTKYREEWDEKTKAEKARETELENLRTDTLTKAAQIRSLEQRAEKSDSEHIEIANELVKLKVENTELVDQNESLKGQVEELRKVADSEAKNVEDRLRAGTDQVMQRNIEVQNENRHMEEQMAEMEKELVGIKMKYAEVSGMTNLNPMINADIQQLNGEHDALKQKWNDLRRALD